MCLAPRCSGRGNSASKFLRTLPSTGPFGTVKPPPSIRNLPHTPNARMKRPDGCAEPLIPAVITGHHIETAGSLQSALQKAKYPFDLLISDIGLPDGSGLDLMRRLQETHPVKGIALSGFGSEQDGTPNAVTFPFLAVPH